MVAVEEQSWVTVVLAGVLSAMIGYGLLRSDFGGQRSLAEKKLAAASPRWQWQKTLYRTHFMIVMGGVLVMIGLIQGVISLLR
jgi:hypothetical protein